MSRRMRLIVSCVCALAAFGACALYTKHVQAEAQRERSEVLRRYGGDTVQLVVAERTLEAGEVVSRGDVSMRDWISSLAPANAFLSLDDVVGREISVPASSDMPLCEMNFRDDSLVADIPSGHVAVSVPITDKLGISPSVTVGVHLQAYCIRDGSAEPIDGSATVLSVPSSAGLSAGRGSITVAIESKAVAAVLSASSAGDLRLVLPAEDVREVSQPEASNRNVAPVDEGGTKDSQETERGVAAQAKQSNAPGSVVEGV